MDSGRGAGSDGLGLREGKAGGRWTSAAARGEKDKGSGAGGYGLGPRGWGR